MANSSNAYVLGVGLTQFIKPRAQRTYPELGFEAGIKALLDASINYDDVDTGIACYCYGDTTSGQRTFYQFGMTNIPIYNTNNACATGSTGLQMARTLIKGRVADCVMVVGMETMKPGPIVSVWNDRPSPMGLSMDIMKDTRGMDDSPRNAQMFGNAGREYMEKYGAELRDFTEIARVSHEHSSRNPYAQFRQVYTLEQIEKAPVIYSPLTKLQCSPTSDGAGAAIVVSEKFLQQRPEMRSHAVLIAGQSLVTDSPSLYNRSAMDLVGAEMSVRASQSAYAEAGVKPSDIKVCELHDCFSANELILLEGLGFCGKGQAHHMVRKGDITYGGKGPVVNPSGGLMSKGHPLGATGLAQCAELVWQLRGWAKNGRLVKDVKVALQHNLGLGGACVVTIYKRADGKTNTQDAVEDSKIAKLSGLGYNPAVEVKPVTRQMADKVRSRKARCDFALGETAQKMEAQARL